MAMADEGEGMGVGGEGEGELGAMAGCSEGEVRAVAGAAAAVLVGAQREDAALDGPVVEQMEVDVIKALYSALACVFAEAAKRDASAEALVAFLRGKCGVPEAQAGVVGEVYAGAKERLRRELGRTGEHSSVSRLKGVDWRLEYRVEDGGGGDAAPRRDLLYHVVLKTAEKADAAEANAKTAFVCSVEQLQDLVLTLKDACKAVERVVHQA
jgi:hypothetical protein